MEMMVILELKLCILHIKSKKGDPQRLEENDIHSQVSWLED